MSKFIKFFLFFTLWVISIFITVNGTSHLCEHNWIYKEGVARKEGRLEAKRAIADAPHITDSSIATKSLGFDVVDTYFAKGTVLRNFLLKVTESEGLKPNYIFGPNVYISIDGNMEGVKVSLSMIRDAYLDVSFDCYNSYKEDIFIRDSVVCFSKTNYFPAGTQYNDVSLWLESELRILCSHIKEKNEKIINKIKAQKE